MHLIPPSCDFISCNSLVIYFTQSALTMLHCCGFPNLFYIVIIRVINYYYYYFLCWKKLTCS